MLQYISNEAHRDKNTKTHVTKGSYIRANKKVLYYTCDGGANYRVATTKIASKSYSMDDEKNI